MSPVTRSSSTPLDTPDRDIGHVAVDNLPATDADGGLKVHVQNQAAGGGAGVDPVSVKDGTNAAQKLAVDANGRIGVNNFPATQPVSGTVAVSGTVPVSGTFWQGTQPVSGTVTVANPTANPETGLAKDTTLTGGTQKAINRGAAKGSTAAGDVTSTAVDANTQALDVSVKGTVPVSGTFWQATQPVSGSVSVSNFPATQPVSGTVTANAGTGPWPVTDNAGSLTVDSAQLPTALAAGGGIKVEGVAGGVAQPVSGTFWQATQPVSLATAPVTPVTDNAGSLTVDSTQLPAALAAGGGLKVEGIVGGVAQPVSISSAPVIQTSPPPVGNKKTTYVVCAGPFTPGATPTDIFTLYGSATKTVVVEKLIIDATQTTAGSNQFFVIKRSAANTGGTSTAPTRVPYDANDAAATAVATQYSVNPTALGAAVGNVRADKIFCPAPATAVDAQGRIFMFGETDMKGIVLRGTAQGIAVNLNGVALPAGLSVNINVEWTEE